MIFKSSIIKWGQAYFREVHLKKYSCSKNRKFTLLIYWCFLASNTLIMSSLFNISKGRNNSLLHSASVSCWKAPYISHLAKRTDSADLSRAIWSKTHYSGYTYWILLNGNCTRFHQTILNTNRIHGFILFYHVAPIDLSSL